MHSFGRVARRETAMSYQTPATSFREATRASQSGHNHLFNRTRHFRFIRAIRWTSRRCTASKQ
jgi:hypothetical protein